MCPSIVRKLAIFPWAGYTMGPSNDAPSCTHRATTLSKSWTSNCSIWLYPLLSCASLSTAFRFNLNPPLPPPSLNSALSSSSSSSFQNVECKSHRYKYITVHRYTTNVHLRNNYPCEINSSGARIMARTNHPYAEARSSQCLLERSWHSKQLPQPLDIKGQPFQKQSTCVCMCVCV